MASKKIIIFLIALFIITSGYLFFIDSRDNSLDFQKNWWVIYFDSPKGDSIDFVIENHSDMNSFHWEVLDGKNKFFGEDVRIMKGNSQKISVPTGNYSDKKITTQVSDGKESKEIYKNFKF